MPRGIPNNKAPKPEVVEAPAATEVPMEVTVSTGTAVAAEQPAPPELQSAKDEPKVEETGCPLNHHIHVLEDGLTLAGQVMYRGQEFDATPDTPEWDLIHPRGKCVLDMDARAQFAKFGRQMWSPGEWPFEPYDLDEDGLTDQDKERLAQENASRSLV